MNKQRHHYGFGKYTVREALAEALIRVLIFTSLLVVCLPIGILGALSWDATAIVMIEGER